MRGRSEGKRTLIWVACNKYEITMNQSTYNALVGIQTPNL